MIRFLVIRYRKSYAYKVNPEAPGSFENNWKNNSLDWFCILDGGKELARFHCQTVANYNFGAYATADTVEHGDTIAPGEFYVKLFVPPRNFHGEIHGIIRCRDLDGQWIACNSMQTTKGGFQNGRFLIHDRYSKKLDKDSNQAWSAGCFILSSDDLAALNSILKSYKLKPGDIVGGYLKEE